MVSEWFPSGSRVVPARSCRRTPRNRPALPRVSGVYGEVGWGGALRNLGDGLKPLLASVPGQDGLLRYAALIVKRYGPRGCAGA